MRIYATRLQNAQTIESLKVQKSFCLVLGNETHGVSEEIITLSDGFIKIGINKEIESLNVASAAAILFYEISKATLTNY